MTQKYTPVEWTDETPTQPGTLINKARLDQMQSAHHFADGFEEVDAIPTEDPGTDYHKVVYCTADTTFYRWDGAQWTADIDDDTKRLLLEHEADHANPHQVTKAQVGLGNADNTADLDKPISTATAVALAGKVDKLGSSPAGSYTKVTVNAQGQVTAGSNPATLAEAGITDAYTKAQVDTKLGDGSVTKLGTADVGSDTLPIKLVGGSPTPVADALAKDSTVVHLNGAETIPGAKTFSVAPVTTGNAYIIKNAGHKYLTFQDGAGTTISTIQLTSIGTINLIPGVASGGINAVTIQGQRAYAAANTTDVATIATLDQYTPMVRTANNQTIAGEKLHTNGLLGQYKYIAIPATGTHYIEVKYKGDVTQMAKVEICDYINNNQSKYLEFYMAWNGGVSGIVQGRYLGGYAPPAGIKYAKDADGYLRLIVPMANYHSATVNVTQARSWNLNVEVTIERADDPDYSALTLLDVPMAGSGSYATAPTRGYNASYTSDVATIATLDAYLPMVRTSGAQTIAGEKIFTDKITVRKDGIGQGYVHINTKMKQAGPYNSGTQVSYLQFLGEDNKSIGNFEVFENADGSRGIRLTLYDKNNGFHYKTLFSIDQDGNTII